RRSHAIPDQHRRAVRTGSPPKRGHDHCKQVADRHEGMGPDASGDDRIVSVSIEQVGDGRDALIGFFRDDSGARYFMITNLWHGAAASAADRSLTVAVKFGPDIDKLYRLDRKIGRPPHVTDFET
ncbi:MAG: hypothetical protein MK179_18320, partial [Pirellulaceae bacterium]|nr:hypothetical protein [Pirellulaceae bacterium]